MSKIVPDSMTSTLHVVSQVDSPPYVVLKLDSLEVLAMYRPISLRHNVLPHLQGIDLYARNPIL